MCGTLFLQYFVSITNNVRYRDHKNKIEEVKEKRKNKRIFNYNDQVVV